jgi:CRISPR-associated exonuclease Cas4
MTIQQIILTSLRTLSKQHTADTLGDRTEYIGASDIGHCPRKVILDRIHPKEHDLASLLRFERGHMAENIIAKIFQAAGYTFERQVEVVVDCAASFRVHIDFVFTSVQSKTKSIMEVKSGKVPEVPYGSWESQLFVQMGALTEKYPDHTIKGALLVVDLDKGGVGIFTGYCPNQMIYGNLKLKAENIWSEYQAMQQGEEIEPTAAPDALCGCCNHLLSCPCFAAEEVPELIPFVEELQVLQAEYKLLKAKIDPKKEELLEIVDRIGKVRVGSHYLNKRVQERSSVDMEKLEKFLSGNGLSVKEFQQTTPASWLEIKKTK